MATGVLQWSGALAAGRLIAARYSLAVRPGARFPRLRESHVPRILILCYHRIGTGGIPFYSQLPPPLFDAQMRFLRKSYRVLSLADACKELQSPAGGEPAVVVTFDDGYSDLFTQAMASLRRYGIPATVYLTAGAIESGEVAWYDRIFLLLKHVPGNVFECGLGTGGDRRFSLTDGASRFAAALEIISVLRTLPDDQRRRRCSELEAGIPLPAAELENRMLTWDQIRIMQAAGVSFGCHTMTHPVVSGLTSEGMYRELVQSKQLLEQRIATPVADFAFPFGKPADCGQDTKSVLRNAGYRSAVTTNNGVNVPGTDLYALHRVSCCEERSLATFAFLLNWCFLQADIESAGGVQSDGAKEDGAPVSVAGSD